MLTTTKHKFVTTVPNDGISSRVQPTAWNDDHALTSHTRADIPSLTVTQDTFAVSGFATAGDLGVGAVYTSVGAGPSGPMAIQDSTGKWFNLVLNGVANVGWFGAKGDANTDDHAAFQAAHTALPAGGGKIVVPAGTYNIATGLTFTKDVLLIGDGAFNTLLQTSNGALTVISTSARIRAEHIGFRYGGAGGSLTTAIGVNITNGDRPSFTHCWFDSFNINLNFTFAHGFYCYDTVFGNAKTYQLYMSNVSTPDEGDHLIVGCEFANSTYPTAPAAIHWVSSGGLKIEGCKFLDHNISIDIAPGAGVATGVIIIAGNSIEGCHVTAINCDNGGSGGTIGYTAITGNEIAAGVTATKILNINAGFRDVVIGNNVLVMGGQASAVAITFGSGYSNGGMISGNNFVDCTQAIQFPVNGAALVAIGQNEYSGVAKTVYSGGSSTGTQHTLLDLKLRTHAQAQSIIGTVFWTFFFKAYFPAFFTADLELAYDGIQQGVGPCAFVRRVKASNSGSAITLTDVLAASGVSVGTTPPVVTFDTTMAGTPGNTEDGVAFGIKCAGAGTQANLAIEVAPRGFISGLKLLSNLDLITGFTWNLSALGTNEYYVTLAAKANPNITIPAVIQQNGTPIVMGAVGSLAAGTWAYGNNDALGFSTVYVRLTDGTNPATKAANYVRYAG